MCVPVARLAAGTDVHLQGDSFYEWPGGTAHKCLHKTKRGNPQRS